MTTWCGLTLGRICRCRLRLDLLWGRWRASVKDISLAGPPWSGETSRLDSMDLVAKQDQVRAAWWQEKQDEVVDCSRCRVATQDRSLHTGFATIHHKPTGYLVEPQNQDQRLGGERRDLGALRSFDARGHVAGSQFLRREDADCGEGMAARWRKIATWRSWPWGVCIFIDILGVAWWFS
jgi:hypothetical protein